MARLFWRDFCEFATPSTLWESGHFYFAPTRKINHLHPLIHSDTIYMADRNPPLEVPQIHNGVTKSTE
jgi:hypothetical protein